MYNDQVLQNAATAVGNGTEIDIHSCNDVTFYSRGAGTTSGGTFVLETADISGFSGTWAPLITTINASAVSAGVLQINQFKGPLRFVRARIATTITGGGTLTVRVVAN